MFNSHTDKPLLELKQVNKSYLYGNKQLQALAAIDLKIQKGETFGVVGESGCGKSTLGKIALGLEKPSSGIIYFKSDDVHSIQREQARKLRQKMQLIFQDPYSSLNPRMTVADIIAEGIDIHHLAKGVARQQRLEELIGQIGLDQSVLARYPHEFSGGQRQRIGIARALAVDPEFIVCDEPLSALDACTQKQVMDLLLHLKALKQLTYLFISHDLHAVRALADTIAVMYLGQIVEQAPTARLFASPSHPYTQALLSAIPIADPIHEKQRTRIILKGEFPSPLNPPSGCPFHPRCPKAMPICRLQPPSRINISDNHSVTCHLHT